MFSSRSLLVLIEINKKETKFSITHSLFQSSVQCQPFTAKLPKLAQPDLNFTSPDIQLQGQCSAQSDMFSLGLLIYSLFNNGRSPLECNLSPVHYAKQYDLVKLPNLYLLHKFSSFIYSIFYFRFL
ncbi:protein kinase domain-containing protein ppk32-like protein [Leptotrombidium deliense]|uniref:Protein kinase domain-containing protein ppk32-like protein n=1 Tax=Leptotrombidium deliense TaxID=299467 RepID=A0A443SKP9_9ACAR|nr:protein kinase domain-containing protein ppk32-like protein [Leptotrombidium deliense]